MTLLVARRASSGHPEAMTPISYCWYIQVPVFVLLCVDKSYRYLGILEARKKPQLFGLSPWHKITNLLQLLNNQGSLIGVSVESSCLGNTLFAGKEVLRRANSYRLI